MKRKPAALKYNDKGDLILPKKYREFFSSGFLGWGRWWTSASYYDRLKAEYLVNAGIAEKRERDGKVEYLVPAQWGVEMGFIPF